MSKPKWRKYKGGWKRGVLSVRRVRISAGKGYWGAFAGYGWITDCASPEAAMRAADAWWERTRKRMEGK